MSHWDKKCEFSQSKEIQNPITSVSISAAGDIVVAGSQSGQVFVFEKRVNSGFWDHVYTWSANVKTIDVKLQKEVTPTVIDTELFQTKRKNPLLLTAGQQDIHIWFLSDKYEPIMPNDFSPNGISFPVSNQRERFITENEVIRVRAHEDNSITSVRACADGLSFAFSENKMVKVGRLDNLSHILTIYDGEQALTRVDFHPKSCDILLAADEKGNCNYIDSRIAPKLNQPALKALSQNHLLGKPTYISECKFSPEGNMFFSRHPGDIIFWDQRNLQKPISVIPLVTDTQRSYIEEKEHWRCSWYDNTVVACGSLGGDMKLVSTSGVIDSCQASSRGRPFFFMKESKKTWERRHSVNAIATVNHSVAAVCNGPKLFIYDCK